MLDSEIPILSIKQPWAWLIANTFKTVENRSWSMNYRGPIYIHASKTKDTLEEDLEWVQGEFVNPEILDLKPAEFAHGCIIGMCEVHKIYTPDEALNLDPDHPDSVHLDDWWGAGSFAWMLRNFHHWEPEHHFEIRGKPGLFYSL